MIVQILDEKHFQRRRSQVDAACTELSEESNGRRLQQADDDENDDEQKECVSIALPLPGCKNIPDVENGGCAETRLVSGVCAVCLIEYAEGDEITWSSNYKCSHAFHAACMTEYIESKREIVPCPMCRQNFLLANDLAIVSTEESTTSTSNEASTVTQGGIS